MASRDVNAALLGLEAFFGAKSEELLELAVICFWGRWRVGHCAAAAVDVHQFFHGSKARC